MTKEEALKLGTVGFKLVLDLQCQSQNVLKAVKPPNIVTRILTVRPSTLDISRWNLYEHVVVSDVQYER